MESEQIYEKLILVSITTVTSSPISRVQIKKVIVKAEEKWRISSHPRYGEVNFDVFLLLNCSIVSTVTLFKLRTFEVEV